MSEAAEALPEYLTKQEMESYFPELKPGHKMILLGGRIYLREDQTWRRLGTCPEPPG